VPVNGTGLTVYGSGTSGNPITILFEPGAQITSEAMSTGINVGSNSYITVDGGAAGTIGGPNGNPALVNGIIQDTANGTSLANQVSSWGIAATDASYLTVQNLAIYNMYVRTGITDENNYSGGVSNEASDTNFTNYTVTNCIIHDAYMGINSDYGPAGADYTFSYNTIYNCNWGGRCGDRNSSSFMKGLYIHHNYFHDWTSWDDTGNEFHHNGFYGWAESGGALANIYVYDNKVGPNYSNVALLGFNDSTSGLFFSGNVGNIFIYNNIFLANSGDAPADGMITVGPNNGYPGIGIYNNTFIGQGSATAINGGAGNCTYTIENNIASGVATFILFNYAASSTLVSNFNLGYNLSSSEAYSYSATSSSNFYAFAGWQGLGHDANSLTSNPNLNENYAPNSGSPAIGAGLNLTSLGITTLDSDMAGTSRLASGAWDIGAYKYTGSLPPPANLHLINGS
jgi:hypothetical protein